MIQSVAYEIIKEEGIREGIKEGKIQGIIEGFQQSLLEALETKFDAIPMRLVKAIKDITDIEILRILQHQAIKCNSVEEFSQKLKLIIK